MQLYAHYHIVQLNTACKNCNSFVPSGFGQNLYSVAASTSRSSSQNPCLLVMWLEAHTSVKLRIKAKDIIMRWQFFSVLSCICKWKYTWTHKHAFFCFSALHAHQTNAGQMTPDYNYSKLSLTNKHTNKSPPCEMGVNKKHYAKSAMSHFHTQEDALKHNGKHLEEAARKGRNKVSVTGFLNNMHCVGWWSFLPACIQYEQ